MKNNSSRDESYEKNSRTHLDRLYNKHGDCVEKKNQLDVTECFFALMTYSTCFGYFYAHHQELETICVITAYGVQCLVAGCGGSGAEQQAMRLG